VANILAYYDMAAIAPV